MDIKERNKQRLIDANKKLEEKITHIVTNEIPQLTSRKEYIQKELDDH